MREVQSRGEVGIAVGRVRYGPWMAMTRLGLDHGRRLYLFPGQEHVQASLDWIWNSKCHSRWREESPSTSELRAGSPGQGCFVGA